MSDIKADVGRVDPQPHNPLNTAPQVKSKVQAEVKQVKVADNSGNKMPDENVARELKEADSQAVESAVSKLNEYVQSTARTLNFQVDDESGKTVIKVYDRESDKLIRQIPNELVLELARRLNEEEPSLLFEAQV